MVRKWYMWSGVHAGRQKEEKEIWHENGTWGLKSDGAFFQAENSRRNGMDGR